MREVAAQLQAEKATAVEAKEVAKHGACALSPRRWKWAATSMC